MSVRRKLSLILAVMVALIVLLMVLSRLTTPTAAQRAAVALMEADELPNGRNAFGMLWTLERDVPEDEIAAVVAADAARVAEWPYFGAPADEPDWRKDAYRDLSPAAQDRALFCGTDTEVACLARVREDTEAVAAALKRNSRLIERTQRLREADVLRSRMPPHLAMLIPAFGHALLPMTAQALAFVQGEQEFAMAETCRDLATWRRLATESDLLIFAMVGIAYVGRGYARLLADMLAEWPVDRPLPATCNAALEPPTDGELLLCNALRGEFRLQKWLFERLPIEENGESRLGRVAEPLFYDRQSTIALAAEQLAPFCRTDRAGLPDYDWPDSTAEVLLRWSCVGNPIGCVLAGTASGGAYGDYARRMQDHGARLRLLAALAWMRAQAAGSGARAAALLARLPPELRDADQPMMLTPDGRRLRVGLRDDARAAWAEVPLPPALWGPTAGDD